MPKVDKMVTAITLVHLESRQQSEAGRLSAPVHSGISPNHVVWTVSDHILVMGGRARYHSSGLICAAEGGEEGRERGQRREVVEGRRGLQKIVEERVSADGDRGEMRPQFAPREQERSAMQTLHSLRAQSDCTALATESKCSSRFLPADCAITDVASAPVQHRASQLRNKRNRYSCCLATCAPTCAV